MAAVSTADDLGDGASIRPGDDGGREQACTLLDGHQAMLRGYLRHLLHDPEEADDVAHDVCVEVLANPAILLRGNDTGSYLRGIARHFASRSARQRRRHLALDDLIELAWKAPEDPTSEAAEAAALRACLSTLGARARSILELRYWSGLSFQDVGRRLEMTAEAVRVAAMRGRQALARCLEQRIGRTP